MRNKNEFISVFTATYNRSNLLQRLFVSLKEQTYMNFEWVIVDDGSTDDTSHVINQFKKEALFEIVYEKQTNQGKHIAINKGLQLAKGKYFFIVDSDDRLPKESIQIISNKIQLIDNKENVAGVVGLKCFFDKTIVGSNNLKNDIICSLLEHRYKYKRLGDRAEVIKTAVFRKFKFPKFNTETFVPESIVWNRMALKYSMLFFPENVYECEYLEDGLSSKSIALRRKNPVGISVLYSELTHIKSIDMVTKFKTHINFWRFYWCLSNSLKRKHFFYIKNHFYTIICMPIGTIMYCKDTLVNYLR